MFELLVSIVAGVLGANLCALLFQAINLGVLKNTVIGLVGGFLGGEALGLVTLGRITDNGGIVEAVDVTSLMAHVGGGAAGGIVMIAAAGLVRSARPR